MRKSGLTFAALALALLAAPPVMAQSFSGFLRGITNTLSGGSNKPAPAQNNSATATIGVRGVDDTDGGNVNASGTAAPASSADLKLLDSWAATRVDAEIAAGKRGLVANKSASYGGAQPAVAAAPSPADAPAPEDAQ